MMSPSTAGMIVLIARIIAIIPFGIAIVVAVTAAVILLAAVIVIIVVGDNSRLSKMSGVCSTRRARAPLSHLALMAPECRPLN